MSTENHFSWQLTWRMLTQVYVVFDFFLFFSFLSLLGLFAPHRCTMTTMRGKAARSSTLLILWWILCRPFIDLQLFIVLGGTDTHWLIYMMLKEMNCDYFAFSDAFLLMSWDKLDGNDELKYCQMHRLQQKKSFLISKLRTRWIYNANSCFYIIHRDSSHWQSLKMICFVFMVL